jgi:hypothetical protein
MLTQTLGETRGLIVAAIAAFGMCIDIEEAGRGREKGSFGDGRFSLSKIDVYRSDRDR